MSDRNERACTNCGSLLHHEDDCRQPLSPQSSVGVEEMENIFNKYAETAQIQGIDFTVLVYNEAKQAMTEYSSLKEIKICVGCGRVLGDNTGNKACCPDGKYLPLRDFIDNWLNEIISIKQENIRLKNYDYNHVLKLQQLLSEKEKEIENLKAELQRRLDSRKAIG